MFVYICVCVRVCVCLNIEFYKQGGLMIYVGCVHVCFCELVGGEENKWRVYTCMFYICDYIIRRLYQSLLT